MGNAFVVHVLHTLTNLSHDIEHHVLWDLPFAVLNHIDESEASLAKLAKDQHLKDLGTCVDVILLIHLRIDVFHYVGVFFALRVCLAKVPPDLNFLLSSQK